MEESTVQHNAIAIAPLDSEIDLKTVFGNTLIRTVLFRYICRTLDHVGSGLPEHPAATDTSEESPRIDYLGIFISEKFLKECSYCITATLDDVFAILIYFSEIKKQT